MDIINQQLSIYLALFWYYQQLPHFGWLFDLGHVFIYNYTTIQKFVISIF